MSEQVWETHDRLCSSRRPSVAYPSFACPECRAIDAARAEGIVEGDKGGRREGHRIGYTEALRMARESVAATHDDDHGFPPLPIVLAAIDALRGES